MEAIHERIRQSIPHIESDQPMEELLTAALKLVKSGELIALHRQYATGEVAEELRQQFDVF